MEPGGHAQDGSELRWVCGRAGARGGGGGVWRRLGSRAYLGPQRLRRTGRRCPSSWAGSRKRTRRHGACQQSRGRLVEMSEVGDGRQGRPARLLDADVGGAGKPAEKLMSCPPTIELAAAWLPPGGRTSSSTIVRTRSPGCACRCHDGQPGAKARRLRRMQPCRVLADPAASRFRTGLPSPGSRPGRHRVPR